MDTKKIQGIVERLKGLNAERDTLMKELETSLAIKAFMPDAFEAGPCKLRAVSGYNPTAKSSKITFELATGEVREFPASEVPEAAWPKTLREAIAKPRRSKLAALMGRNDTGDLNPA